MRPLKQVGLRLTEDLLARVDELQGDPGEGHASRSESLRQLIEAGLDRHALGLRLTDIESRLDRIDHILERTHHLSFMCFQMLIRNRPDFKDQLDQEMSTSKTSLANSLIDRFGK